MSTADIKEIVKEKSVRQPFGSRAEEAVAAGPLPLLGTGVTQSPPTYMTLLRAAWFRKRRCWLRSAAVIRRRSLS